MATAQKEIPMDDAELDALMAELDAETSDMVTTPTAAPASAPEPTPPQIDDQDIAEMEAELQAAAPEHGDAASINSEPSAAVDGGELEALAAELNAAGQVSTNDTVALAQAEVARKSDEDELAALQAELDAEEKTAEPVTAAERRVTDGVKPSLAAGGAPAPTEKPALVGEQPSEAIAHPNPPKPKQQPKLQFYLDVDQFKAEIAVSENNLDNAMMQQAGLFAFHAAEAARAEAQHARVKLRFDVVEAKLYDRHRKAIAATGEKATEKAIENAVRQDPEWLQAKNLVIEAEMLADFNRGAVESLRHRKDMIVQLGADRREETKGQTRIIAADASHAGMKARALSAAA